MYNPARNAILKVLKVPPEPHAPLGSPGSLRIFRAGRNYFRLKLLGWGITQLIALAGIIFWLEVFVTVEKEVDRRRANNEVPVSPRSVKDFAEYIQKVEAEDATKADAPAEEQPPGTDEQQPKPRRRIHIEGWEGWKRLMVELALLLPPWAIPILWILKIAGIVFYLVQIPITYFMRRLDYEMRWYIVTDRSLRLRWGVSKVYEITMSFANLQQVEVSQNPIQRILGLGDVRVQSAGGGGSEVKHAKNPDESMHRARFHAVENASEIRDLILERLKRYRQAGLGDPDDPHHDDEPAPAPPLLSAPGTAVDAARELLAEAKALRASL